ncbi:MAG TPA: hypothetical protein PLA50_00255 [Bacteroidia bacterium]|nr:hypothetical protein [Bacteroidia bacterium]
MSYAVLVIVALLSLRSSVNTTSGQAWTVKQTMSDAYIARESALASRLPFDTVVGAESPWARHPSVATSTVTIGRLPGGQAVTATLHRTRIPDANNLASAAGSGTSATNPSGTEAWQLQTVLAYDVGGRQYVKSRTVLRIR